MLGIAIQLKDKNREINKRMFYAENPRALIQPDRSIHVCLGLVGFEMWKTN